MAKDLIKDFVGGTDEAFSKYVEVSHNPPQDVVDKLKEDTGHTTYPFIYFDGSFVGGFDQLKKPKMTIKILSTLQSKYGIDDDEQF